MTSTLRQVTSHGHSGIPAPVVTTSSSNCAAATFTVGIMHSAVFVLDL